MLHEEGSAVERDFVKGDGPERFDRGAPRSRARFPEFPQVSEDEDRLPLALPFLNEGANRTDGLFHRRAGLVAKICLLDDAIRKEGDAMLHSGWVAVV